MAAVDNNAPTEVASSCRKVPRDENAGFMGNLKIWYNDFTNASMKEHKECFYEHMRHRMYQTTDCWNNTRDTMEHKVYKSWNKIFGGESGVTNEGENSATALQPSPRN